MPKARSDPAGNRALDALRRHLGEHGLYARVFAVNAVVLGVAVALLVVTPLSVDPDTTTRQVTILLVGLAVMLAANALLLRLSLRPLRRLRERMASVDMLRPGTRLDPTGSVEVAAVIRAFNATIDRLENERRSTMHRVLSAQEGERRRVAQELHDEIGQNLMAVVLELGQVLERNPAERELLADARELARESLDQLSLISQELRPPMLDDLGLTSALAALCAGLARRTGVAIEFQPDEDPPALDGSVELAVYRVAQEALTNAIRHSHGSSVRVALNARPAELTLSIRDNGTGLAGAAGAGIRGMRERALTIGAALEIHSPAAGGVEVVLHVPNGKDPARG
jgi:two-component system sensor histidine kinase UhpB